MVPDLDNCLKPRTDASTPRPRLHTHVRMHAASQPTGTACYDHSCVLPSYAQPCMDARASSGRALWRHRMMERAVLCRGNARESCSVRHHGVRTPCPVKAQAYLIWTTDGLPLAQKNLSYTTIIDHARSESYDDIRCDI